MIDSRKLIAVARLLNVSHDDEPLEAEAIRRAVSTAYFALFHALLRAGAERFIGASDKSAAFEIMYRSFAHARIGRVLEAVDKDRLSDGYARRLMRSSMSQEIRDFAAVFVSLQQIRHLADYSPSATISREEASGVIDEAESAMSIFEQADPQEKTDILALMLVDSR